MVLYPAGYDVRGIEVDPSVTLPQGSEFATALDRAPDYPSAPFKRTSLETPRRWVVERTLAWLNRNRRLAKDFEASIASAKAWVYIASVQLLIRRLA